MTDEAKSFFRRTRIASPCGSIKHDAGHPLFGNAGDRGPENAVDVFLSLAPAARREVYGLLGSAIYYPVAEAGHDWASLLTDEAP